MIELVNVSKIYITQSKRKVCALNDVTLRFPEKGLCVLMGQSGCGKTTLLNILGGLDNKFDGEYIFLDKQLNSARDYARFRRDYIGFVFQDFNLVADLTVGDNIALGYRFTRFDETDKIKQTLSTVGLDGYEDRYPSELSGGEQQRVAIARAVLKDCSLLLADEPTGNLDKKTGREIYKLLKEISKNKLVIVVSHDEELGKEFADYTVFLENGNVISDNLPNTISSECYIEKKQKAISNRVSLKMAWHECWKKKGQAIVNIALMVLCFMVLSFAAGVFQYNAADVHYRLITSQNYEYFYLSEISGSEWSQYVVNEGIVSVRSNYDDPYFTSKKEAEQYGIRFYEFDNTMELSANVYYLSDEVAKRLIERGEEAYINGKRVLLDEQKHGIRDLIGAVLPGCVYQGVCGGIYYSDREKTTSDDRVLDYHTLWKQGVIDWPNFQFNAIEQRITVNSNRENLLSQINIMTGMDPPLTARSCLVLTDTGELKMYRDASDGSILESLGNGEAYLSLRTYNELFGTNYSEQDLIDIEVVNESLDVLTEVKMLPSGVGSNLDITIHNKQTDDELALNELKVKGIILFVNLSWNPLDDYGTVRFESDWRRDCYENLLYINDMNIVSKCLQYGPVEQVGAWIKTDSVKDLKSFLRGIYDRNEGISSRIVSTPFMHDESRLEDYVNAISIVLLVLGIPLLVTTILVLNLTVSAQIKNRARELGIFKAFGAQNKDLLKIYIYEILFIAVPTMLLAILGAWVTTLSANALIVSAYVPQLQLLYYGWINVPLTFIIGTIMILFAILAPLNKITKINVIEAIRNS